MLDRLDAATLNELLADAGDPRRVAGVTVEPFSQGTTDRARVRVAWASGDDREEWFGKGTASSRLNRVVAAVLGIARAEVAFYAGPRSELSGIAPRMLAGRAGRAGSFLLVTEDLTADGGIPLSLDDECELVHAEEMMDTLAELHRTFWESPRFGGDLAWVRPRRQRVGFRFLRLGLRWGRRGILRSDFDIPAPVRELTAFMNREQSRLDRVWEEGPLTLNHGDSHLGNTYRRADGGAGLLDWQVVNRAPGMRDVSYFLTSGLPVELRRAHERELVTRYLDGLGACAPDFDRAWGQYRFFAVDAWDSVAVTYTAGDMQTGGALEAAYHRNVAALVDLDSLGAARGALR